MLAIPRFSTPYSLVIDYSHCETMLLIGGNLSLASVVHSLSPGGPLRNWQLTATHGPYDDHPALEYTFIAAFQQTCSCSQGFFVNSLIVTDITDTLIHPITINNDAPGFLSLINEVITAPNRTWLFNSSFKTRFHWVSQKGGRLASRLIIR